MLQKLNNTILIKILLILGSLYLLSLLWPTLIAVINTIIQILIPFIIGFIIAYLLLPIINYLQSKGIKRSFSILIVVLSVIAIITLIVFLIGKDLYSSVTELYNSYIHGLDYLQNIVLNNFGYDISDYINSFKEQITNYIKNFQDNFKVDANTIFSIISNIVSFTIQAVFSIVIGLYILADSSGIKDKAMRNLGLINKDAPIYVRKIDEELSKYVKSYLLLFIIKTIEYIIIYFLLMNKNYIALGILTGISVFIPYIGGLAVATIGILTLPSNSPIHQYIIAIVVLTIMSNVDEYFISPKIYSHSLKVSPLLILFAVFAGSTLYGMAGVIVAIPLMVIINISIQTYLLLRKEKDLTKEQNII